MTATTTDAQHQAILDAAITLLATGGADALRVRDIAAQAQCSTMGVYSRFGGKEGVVDAIFVDGFHRFADALREQLTAPVTDQLVRLGRIYRTWALANPGPYMVMFTEAVPGFRPREQSLAVAGAAFELLLTAVRSAQDQDLLRAGETAEIAWSVWGLTHGLVMLELRDVRPPQLAQDPDGVFDIALKAMLDGFAYLHPNGV